MLPSLSRGYRREVSRTCLLAPVTRAKRVSSGGTESHGAGAIFCRAQKGTGAMRCRSKTRVTGVQVTATDRNEMQDVRMDGVDAVTVSV